MSDTGQDQNDVNAVDSGSTAESAQWYDYLVDSLELEEPNDPIPSYRPGVAESSLQEYFRKPEYPYQYRMDAKTYYRTKFHLQVELVKLQNWVKQTHSKILIIFEGRDAAGKGSAIKRFTEHLNPRGAKVVALDKPTDMERGQWYFQRYVDHLPNAGEIALFDRSWYNRAGVERVMGFCTEQEYWKFVGQVPLFEHILADDGVHLIKFYLSISKQEQARRLAERRDNPLKHWKLSPIDQQAQERWDAYTQAKEETFGLTDSDHAPWTIIKADDKLRARLEVMRWTLCQFDYSEKDSEVVGTPDPLIAASRLNNLAGKQQTTKQTTRPAIDLS